MKSKNISKNMKGQVQTMGKGGIQQMSNINPVQPIQNYNTNNYNNNYNMNQMYPMNPMYPMNQMNPINPMNPYPYWNQNNQMNNRNMYENSKKNNNMNYNNNNPIVRNAQMILNNNNMNNNMNKNINGLKHNKKSQSAKSINNNNINYNNNNNYMYNNNMNNNNRSPPQQFKKLKDYQFMEFHPYTLKDYKELTRNPVVMGPLGANIGTKEWEQKRNKMKKMMNYSNNLNKEHKGIRSLKKDTPKDEIEKLTKEKIEKSIRHRTYEYGKLIRTGKYKEDYEEKDFNQFNNNNLNVIPENQENDYYNNRPEINNINNNESNNIISNENSNNFMIEENNMKENNINIDNIERESEINYGQLLKQNEEYKNKIQDIKDQLLD